MHLKTAPLRRNSGSPSFFLRRPSAEQCRQSHVIDADSRRRHRGPQTEDLNPSAAGSTGHDGRAANAGCAAAAA
eukprot:7424703-Prorocentrum_lima.AAC.1